MNQSEHSYVLFGYERNTPRKLVFPGGGTQFELIRVRWVEKFIGAALKYLFVNVLLLQVERFPFIQLSAIYLLNVTFRVWAADVTVFGDVISMKSRDTQRYHVFSFLVVIVRLSLSPVLCISS